MTFNFEIEITLYHQFQSSSMIISSSVLCLFTVALKKVIFFLSFGSNFLKNARILTSLLTKGMPDFKVQGIYDQKVNKQSSKE